MINFPEAADMLYSARAQGRKCAPLGVENMPDLETAYRVSDACFQRVGTSLTGWKAGLTAKAMWPRFNASEPFYSLVASAFVVPSGAHLPTPPGLLGIELEYAFTLRRDLPVDKAPYTAEMVEPAIANVFPLIEVVALRQDVPKLDDARVMIADFGGNAAMITGTRHAAWRGVDYTGAPVRVLVGGEERAIGTGAAVLEHPLNALAFVATKAASRGRGLHEGQWVTTGSCVGIVPVSAGETVVGDFGVLGEVSVTLA